MSRQASSDPGGSWQSQSDTTVNVPQVQGKSEASIAELMEEIVTGMEDAEMGRSSGV